MELSLYLFDCNDKDKALITSLFRKYNDVSSKNDDDIGCTDTVQHRNRLTDNAPVSQQYSRIPPSQFEEVK